MTRGIVHVWVVRLDATVVDVSAMLDLLSGEERVRAARLRTTHARLRFIVAHGALRSILAQYLGVAASAIGFAKTALGKPYVPGMPLTFNLSHSDELAVVAVAGEGEVGVDVERVRAMADADDIVKRFFSPREAQTYSSIPALDRLATFFSTWTRKEAFVKAKGLGLQQPLNSFEVEMSPANTTPRLVIPGDSSIGPASFSLRSFIPCEGYVGAVALDRDIELLTFFHWDASGWRVHVGDTLH